MSKHTPGPWRVDAALDEDGNPLFVQVLTAQNYEVANTANGNFGDATELANARLIAAAPEILEALRLCIAQLKADEPDFGLEGDAIYAAEMAIKKVEGKQ